MLISHSLTLYRTRRLFQTLAFADVLGQELSSVASMPQHITCLLSESGLLWIGTSDGFILTISLPRLEGVPQVRGRPTVSYHAQSGAVRFLSAVQCNMVPVGTAAGKSADPALTPVKEEASTPPAKSNGVALTDDGLLGPLQKQPSWVSTPDLSFMNDSDPDEDHGSVTDLYGSLLKGIDADFDSELADPNAVVRRYNHGINPSTINAVSNRVINRLSNVISKGRADVRARLRPQPMPKAFRQASLPVTDANQNTNSARIYEEADQGSSHESLSSPSLPEWVSSNNATESVAAFEHGSAANTSYRRLVVPACPSMVTSNLVHVQSSKALIIVSGGSGYKCWNKNRAVDSPSADDSCLLLWKC